MKIDQHQRWRSIFAAVIEEYQDLKSRVGHTVSFDYEQIGMAAGGGGGRCTKIVAPNVSDFICDVELAARRVLNPSEFGFFQHFYIGLADPNTIPHKSALNMAVMEKVGRILQARHIYPARQYFRPRDVR